MRAPLPEKAIFKSPIGQLVVDFLNYIEIEKGRSLKTRENYEHYLVVFLQHTGIKEADEINPTLVTGFRLWLNRQVTGNNRASNETLSRKTQNYYLIALRAFLKYLARQEVKTMPAERIELAKTPERSLDLITSEELRRLMDAPMSESKNEYEKSKPKNEAEAQARKIKKLRDRAILELLFSTGLRVSELCALNRDINLRTDELSIRGKGNKVRVVFLSDDSKRMVKEYLDARQDMDEALFVKVGNEKVVIIKKDPREKTEKAPGKKQKENTGLTTRSVERIVKQCATQAGISKKVTPHVIRHCFATDLLSNGADLRSVQALLGHANIATTQVYTHVTDKHLRDIHKRFHNGGK